MLFLLRCPKGWCHRHFRDGTRGMDPHAINVSRLLPRFIVQSGAKSQMVAVASKSLAFVLQKLSKDAVITTLYTLGNVLGSGSDRAVTNGAGEAAGQGPSLVYGSRHSTGSSISLQISGEEESPIVQGNVVQAICEIAGASKDEKITGLAQSMLAQKMVKLSSPLDARVITGAASLALSGGQSEFRYLLKRYAAVAHDAVMENKDGILQGVSVSMLRCRFDATISHTDFILDFKGPNPYFSQHSTGFTLVYYLPRRFTRRHHLPRRRPCQPKSPCEGIRCRTCCS